MRAGSSTHSPFFNFLPLRQMHCPSVNLPPLHVIFFLLGSFGFGGFGSSGCGGFGSSGCGGFGSSGFGGFGSSGFGLVFYLYFHK